MRHHDRATPPITGSLWGKFAFGRWIPHYDEALLLFGCYHGKTVEKAIQLPIIWGYRFEMPWRLMASLKWLVIYSLIHISTKCFNRDITPRTYGFNRDYWNTITMDVLRCYRVELLTRSHSELKNSYRAHNFVGRWIRWLCPIHIMAFLVDGHYGLWPFRPVAVSVFVAIRVCGRFGLWFLRFVTVSVCDRSGLSLFWFVAM